MLWRERACTSCMGPKCGLSPPHSDFPTPPCNRWVANWLSSSINVTPTVNTPSTTTSNTSPLAMPILKRGPAHSASGPAAAPLLPPLAPVLEPELLPLFLQLPHDFLLRLGQPLQAHVGGDGESEPLQVPGAPGPLGLLAGAPLEGLLPGRLTELWGPQAIPVRRRGGKDREAKGQRGEEWD
jgi:hypothetical protein